MSCFLTILQYKLSCSELHTYLNFYENQHLTKGLQGGQDCTMIDQSNHRLNTPKNIKH